MTRKRLDTRVFTAPVSKEQIERGFNYAPKNEEESNLFAVLRMLAENQETLDSQLSTLPPAMLDHGNRFALRTKRYVTYEKDSKTWYVFNGRFCQIAPPWFLLKCVDMVSQGLAREAKIQYALRDEKLKSLEQGFCKGKPLTGEDLASKLVELQDRVLAYAENHPEENVHPEMVKDAVYSIVQMDKQAGGLLSESQKVREGKQPVTLLEQGAMSQGVSHRLEDYDKDGLLKVVKNGTLDLRYLDTPEKLLRPSLPEDLNTMCMNVEYDPTAKAPHVEEQISWIFLQPGVEDKHKPEMLKYARMIMGGALDSTRVKGTFLIIYGKAGSGKSMLLSALAHLFGTYVARVGGSFFIDNPHRGKGDASPHLVQVVNKALVIATEVKNAAVSQLDETLIKNWTSGTDHIDYRPMYAKSDLHFFPRGQLMMSTNDKPRLSGDEAVGDRYRLAVHQCSRKVSEEMRQDENVLQDTLNKEASGFLNILLQGLRERNAIPGRIVQPAPILEESEKYLLDYDDLGEFFKKHGIQADSTSQARGASSEELYKIYLKDVGENATDTLSLKMFARKLQGKGFSNIRTAKGFVWKGIILPVKDKAEFNSQGTQSIDAYSNAHSENGHTPGGLLQDLADMDEVFSEVEGL